MRPEVYETREIPAEWLAEFEAAARRPLEVRMKYAFIRTYKPVLDDARFRSFDSMEAYRDVVRSEPAGLARLWPRLSIACHNDDIIGLKEAANRAKDGRSFRNCWKRSPRAAHGAAAGHGPAPLA